MNFRQFFALLIFFAGLFKIEATTDVAPLYEENDDGVTVTTKAGALELRVFSPWVIEVVHLSEDSLPQPHSLAVIAQTMPTHWKVSKKGDEVLLRTSQLVAHVSTITGSVSFYDASGQLVLQEKADGGSSFTRSRINGLNTLRSRQQFILAPDEGIYGLGQHQNGLMNYRGSMIHLQQQNPTESAVPVLVSSRGYGILWDNPAITDVSVGAGERQVIPADQFYTESGQPGGLTARYYQGDNFDKPVQTNVDAQVDFDWTEKPPTGLPHDHYSVRWTGFVKVKATLFRVHGTGHPKEMWRFDTNTENILIQYDQLRYHLIPYIYSVSWAVTRYGDTMMRPLVMDFQQDTNVFDISDQYLFGPSLMACPVTKAGATTRPVYLPAGTSWTDFWTGKSYRGGQTVVADAPIETMPLFVRAGSIIPYAPPHQYAMQSDDPLELRVYRGVSGEFTLYDDEGDNYDYEAGKYSTIPITWDEAKQTLVIGKRQGTFPGMLEQRKFHIIWVSPGHGSGIASTETPDVVVNYTGKKVKIRR